MVKKYPNIRIKNKVFETKISVPVKVFEIEDIDVLFEDEKGNKG
jgi:hypothetical protein